MITTVLAWLAGSRWTLWAGLAVTGALILFATFRVWRAGIRADQLGQMQARANVEMLARLAKRMSTDEEIRRMAPADRRDRLRAWSRDDG